MPRDLYQDLGPPDDAQTRRDEVMAPFLEQLRQLSHQAVEALEPIREQYVEVVEEFRADIDPYAEQMSELWDRVRALADNADITLPGRPQPEVDVDESGALYDTRRHWWDQLQHYQDVQGRDSGIRTRQCAQCDAEFTPARKDGAYCSENCRSRAHRARKIGDRARQCADCRAEFTPKRSDASYCSAPCRKRANQRTNGGRS